MPPRIYNSLSIYFLKNVYFCGTELSKKEIEIIRYRMTLKAMKRKDITRVALAILLLLFPLSKTEAQHSSPYITIKNNLLYDVLLIPNLGADIYVGKNWSVSTQFRA